MQQSDALGRRNQPDACEENVERAERDLACSQPPELTKTRNSSDRKKGQVRNAGADCEFGEKARCDIAMTPKPPDGSQRAAGKDLQLEHPNDRRKGSRAPPTPNVNHATEETSECRKSANTANITTAHTTSFRNAALPRPRAKKAKRQTSCTNRNGSEIPTMLSTVRKDPPTLAPAMRQPIPTTIPAISAVPADPLDAITPLVRRYGTVPDDQQLSGYRPNGSQRKSERRVRHTEGAEIPGTDGPGDEQAEQKVGGAREQLVRKAPPEPPDHAHATDFAATDKLSPNNPADPIERSLRSAASSTSLRRSAEGAARRHATDGGAGLRCC